MPIVTSLPPSGDDLQAFGAYGLVLRTRILWGMELLPTSPALICYPVSNYETATNPAFLKAILPQTFTRLGTWPPPFIDDEVTGSPRLNILPAADPYNTMETYQYVMMVSIIISRLLRAIIKFNQRRTLSPTQCSALYDQLLAIMVFKNQAVTNEQKHPIYPSLSTALNECLYGGTPSVR